MEAFDASPVILHLLDKQLLDLWLQFCGAPQAICQTVNHSDTSLLECLGPEGRVDIGFGSNTSCANSFVVPVSHRIGVEHQQSVVALISALSVCLVLGTSLKCKHRRYFPKQPSWGERETLNINCASKSRPFTRNGSQAEQGSYTI